MKRFRLLLIICCLFFLYTLMAASSGFAQSQTHPVFAQRARPTLISDQFSFTEGPAADKEGNVFFTDQPNNKIWEYTTEGTLSVFMDSAGRSNGLYFDHQGNLIAAADENDQLWSITPHKKITVLVKNFNGHRLNGPNDLWIDPKGGIYFTDPYYQRDYWERTQKDIPQQRVYYLTPDRQTVRIAADNLNKPNGIIGTPDGKTLYVADAGADKTYKFSINPDARLTHRQLFAEMGSDGMTIDANGNIYLTGDGVTVFDAGGKKIDHLAVDEDWTANVTFGGPHRRTLFITASEGFYKIRPHFKGAR